MNILADNNRSFVFIESPEGHKSKVDVRYFTRFGVCLEGTPAHIQHNDVVQVIFDYYLDNKLHIIKSTAMVDRKDPQRQRLHFLAGSEAMEVATRLSRESLADDTPHRVDAEAIGTHNHSGQRSEDLSLEA